MLKELLLATLLRIPHVDQVEAPPPSLPEPAPLAAIPPSVIGVPVSLDLSPLHALVENKVPPTIDAMGAWTMVADDKIGLKYRASRAPFLLSLHGGSLKASTLIKYEAVACLRQRKPRPLRGYICPAIASCGRHERKRQLHVTMTSLLSWSPDWHIATKTSFQSDHPNRCRVTFLDYDVTRHIDRALFPKLEKVAKDIDVRVRERTNLREHITEFWRVVSAPIELHPSVWLTLSPQKILVAPLSGSELLLKSSIGLTLQPAINFGPRPEAKEHPLPSLAVAEPQRGFHIALEARLSFEEATRRLRSELQGSTLTFEGHEAQVKEVEVRGEKGVLVVKLALHVPSGLRRPTDAVVYLTGHPRYDTTTGTLLVDDLNYSLETRSALLNEFEKLLHDELRSKLQAKARWELGGLIQTARSELEAALNRSVTPAVSLQGSLEELQPLGVVTTKEGFSVLVQASGDVEAVLKLPP